MNNDRYNFGITALPLVIDSKPGKLTGAALRKAIKHISQLYGTTSENMWPNGNVGAISIKESEFIEFANPFNPFKLR